MRRAIQLYDANDISHTVGFSGQVQDFLMRMTLAIKHGKECHEIPNSLAIWCAHDATTPRKNHVLRHMMVLDVYNKGLGSVQARLA